MKHYQQPSMVSQTHKSVRYMLSEAREIVKDQYKITNTRQINHFKKESFTLEHLSTKLISLHPHPKPQDQIAKIKIKKRPFSQVHTSSQNVGATNTLNTIQKRQICRTAKSPQIKFSSFLIKEQAELIDTSNRKLKKSNSKNRIKKTIFPTIIKSKTNRIITQSSGKYCLTISIQALQKIADQRIRKSLALKTLAAADPQPIKQINKKKSIFDVGKKEERKQERKQDFKQKEDYKQKEGNKQEIKQKINMYCQPWINQQDENDLVLL